jgi:hypothetical protein
MTDKQTQDLPAEGNMKKDPDNWVTGQEPMTGAQRSYLKTLSEEAKQPFDENLTKADASRRIEELQAETGRHPPGQEPNSEGRQAGQQQAGQQQAASETQAKPSGSGRAGKASGQER